MARNRFGYLLLLCVAIYLSIMYHEFITTSVVLLLFLYPIVLFGCTAIAKRCFEIHLLTDRPVAEKQKLFYILLLLSNRSIFPLPKVCIELRYQNKFSEQWKKELYYISLQERCTQQISCGVKCEYCGNVEFKLGRVYLYDPLGLFCFRIPVNQSMKVSVLPKFYELAQVKLSWNGDVLLEEESYSTVKGGDDPSELYKLREYLPGDRMNRVHWKLTAKEGSLMIKEFGLPLDCSVVLLLETAQEGKDTEVLTDAVLESASSLSMHLVRMKTLHFLAWLDKSGEVKRNRIDSEERLYETLAEIFESRLTGTGELFTAYQTRYSIEQYSNLFYLSDRQKLLDADKLRGFSKQAAVWFLWITKSQEFSATDREQFLQQDIHPVLIHTEALEADLDRLFEE